jgi:hypothetical protein
MKLYTDIEQSKKLAEILPIESADMRYGYIVPYYFSDRMIGGKYGEVPYLKDFLRKNPNFSTNDYYEELPAWSLAALLNVLPEPSLIQNQEGSWMLRIWDKNSFPWSVGGHINPVDACYEMILKLYEQKLL